MDGKLWIITVNTRKGFPDALVFTVSHLVLYVYVYDFENC